MSEEQIRAPSPEYLEPSIQLDECLESPEECPEIPLEEIPQEFTDTYEKGVASCVGGIWRNAYTGELTHAGLGLREPGAMRAYGSRLEDGTVPLPQCPYFSGEVRLPVFMIDWEDFHPVTDLSNENNPLSDFPNYIPSTPEELDAYLHGPSGVAQYFQDVSGGEASLAFDIFGWIRSDTTDSYLQPRSEYLYNLHDLNPTLPDPTWRCKGDKVFLDTVRDAVTLHGTDLTDYDADRNGVIDGAVLVYEGHGGLCSGGNLSNVGASYGFSETPHTFSFLYPNWPPFSNQEVRLNLYNNIPERSSGTSFYSIATWAHELGHLLLGYPDYYYSRFRLGDWGLSGNHRTIPTHPAAFEKWLFARWIEPTTITTSGEYSLKANEIPDGSSYDEGPYLYVIPIDGDPNRFLTIESRWFDSEGNDTTQWANAYGRESGLLIGEFNLGVDWYSSNPPQFLRHYPPARTGQSDTSALLKNAYRPGDTFSQCYDTLCVTITPLDPAGPDVRISVEITPTE